MFLENHAQVLVVICVALTFKVDLGVIHLHAVTKVHDPRGNTFRDMNFFLVFFS